MAFFLLRRVFPSLQHYACHRSFTLCRNQRTFSSSPKAMSIHITPEVSLFDEKIRIVVQGLPSKAKVTMSATTRQIWQKEPVEFVSCSHHVSCDRGILDLNRDASVGGSYTGLDPMGLFWSLKPSLAGPQNIRMVVRNGDEPVLYTLSVYHGHLSLDGLVSADSAGHKSVFSTSLARLKRSADVRRIPLTEGSVRGTLFLPPGDGPHPGVIDMYGTAGGLMELRAGLLASRGFAVLALPIFAYKDLPARLQDVTLDYFEESLSWFCAHKAVKDGGIGIIGLSVGGGFAAAMAWLFPQVRAIVRINSHSCPVIADLRYKDGMLKKRGVRMNTTFLEKTECGASFKKCFPHIQEDCIPVWETSAAHVLNFTSGDDQIFDPKQTDIFYNMYPEDKRHLVEVVHYPGAGHLLEPPYSPHCSHCISPNVQLGDLDVAWGGNQADHAAAQEDSWKRIQKFFKLHLF